MNVPRQEVMDRALNGTIKSHEFKTQIVPFVKENNLAISKDHEVVISKNTLDFRFPCPVMEKTSEKSERETITIENKTKHKKIYYEVETRFNPKFDLACDQPFGEVRKGHSVPLTFSLGVFCTTRLYQMIRISITLKNPYKSKSKFKTPGRKDSQTNSLRATLKDEHVIGHLYMCFKIESELSSTIDPDELHIEKKIARGGFGTVYQAEWRTTKVAVKELQNTEDLVDEEKEALKREIRILKALAHQHVVTYMGTTLNMKGKPLCIVMEFISGGSLADLIKKPLSERFKCKLCLDVANGMSFMHSNSIVHRDLKPDNILVVSEDPNTAVNLKITDFGTSSDARLAVTNSDYLSFDQAKSEDSEKEKRHTPGVGTLAYQAPEVLLGKKNYNAAATDVFSFAILAWEVFSQREIFADPPYSSMNKFEIIDFVTSGKRIEIPPTVPQRIQQLIKQCWHQNPNARPTFAECVQLLNSLLPKLSGQNSEASSPKQSIDGLEIRDLPANTEDEMKNISWFGTISRQEAEDKLKNCEAGTFLVRWSNHTSSYVLSYTSGGNKFQHIAYIRPEKDGSITVDKQDGSVSRYANLSQYIEAMKKSGVIKKPYNQPIVEDVYARSPDSIYTKAEQRIFCTFGIS